MAEVSPFNLFEVSLEPGIVLVITIKMPRQRADRQELGEARRQRRCYV